MSNNVQMTLGSFHLVSYHLTRPLMQMTGGQRIAWAVNCDLLVP